MRRILMVMILFLGCTYKSPEYRTYHLEIFNWADGYV